MQTLYKKDARQFISIFVKNLDIADYNEARLCFEKYLKTNKMECIVTSTNKIVYAYGKKVEPYLNYELSDKLKELSTDIHFGGMRSTNLEITDGNYIKSVFYCEPLKSFKGIGCIVIFYKQDYSEQAYNLLTKIK
ncbi:MAG: hypothetical protein IJ572_01565 [Bacilli bacterium]|nr:hypothetical protein [Bacilli bacterium]